MNAENITEPVKIPCLKPNITVEIKLGTAFIQKVQECLMYHVEGHEEEGKTLAAKNGDYSVLTPWESTYLMFITLLQEISKVAESAGNIEYKTAEEIASELDLKGGEQV